MTSFRGGKRYSSKTNSLKMRELVAWALVSFLFVLNLMKSNQAQSDSGRNRKSYPSLRTTDGYEQAWHGGNPAEIPNGSCWCGWDNYCMCTPSLAIDAVLIEEGNNESVWLVKRKDTGQYATVGGFVEVGESIETTLVREVNEETGLKINVLQATLLGVYSDSRRDLRRHTASAAFVVTLPKDSQLHAGDDAKGVELVKIHDIPSLDMFSDHKAILADFLRLIVKNDDISPEVIPKNDVPFSRSTCTH